MDGPPCIFWANLTTFSLWFTDATYSVVLSRCTAAHPLHDRFANMFGASISETKMRLDPRRVPRDPGVGPRHADEDHADAAGVAAPGRCDAFGLIGTTFRELVWKTLIFFERAVPISPNAWYDSRACAFKRQLEHRRGVSNLKTISLGPSFENLCSSCVLNAYG